MTVAVRRVTITIGKEEFAWASKRAKREGRSVSAVLTEATREAREAEAKRERQRNAWDELTAWVTDGRGFTAAELDAARKEFDGE